MMAEPFGLTLSKHGLTLDRKHTTTLQINVGLLCNQRCRHCHLSAGPDRKESMDLETVDEVVAYAQRGHFEMIDITGGSPELNPNLANLIERLSPLAPRIMLRSNLTALNETTKDHAMDLLKEHRVVLVASLPSTNESQTDFQRGGSAFRTSISTLKKLNAMGYAQDGSGLELNLVSNPTGIFLSPSQSHTETEFRQVLEQNWGIFFNNLFNFANVPLGRFFQWLLQSGNFETYMQRLASNFNPGAVEGLMCRTLVSVSWDGYLYDCDFNLAKGLFMGGRNIHISEMSGPPELGSPIAVADHCYTCTAGAGFT
jgi:radical SAM/Cys-rich protein